MLDHGVLFRGNLLGLSFAAEHILKLSALVNLGGEANFVHQPAIIPTVHDDANAAGNGQFIGDNPLAGRGNIVTARGREVAHGRDNGLPGFFLKIVKQPIDFIRSEDFAAGRIDFEDDGFDLVIVLGALQLGFDNIDQIIAASISDAAGDNSLDIDDGDFVGSFIIFDDDFFQSRTARMNVFATGGNEVPGEMANVAQEAENQQHQQN